MGRAASTEEMEQPAKQWQIASIEQELKQVNEKLDTLIDAARAYVTQDQLTKGVAEAKQYADDEHAITEERYGPIYRLFWGVLTAVVVQAAGLVFMLLTRK